MSVSRFSRNTADSLSTIRKLKDHGVEVYFENLKKIRNLISGGKRTLQQQTALWEENRLLEK